MATVTKATGLVASTCYLTVLESEVLGPGVFLPRVLREPAPGGHRTPGWLCWARCTSCSHCPLPTVFLSSRPPSYSRPDDHTACLGIPGPSPHLPNVISSTVRSHDLRVPGPAPLQGAAWRRCPLIPWPQQSTACSRPQRHKDPALTGRKTQLLGRVQPHRRCGRHSVTMTSLSW